MLDRISDGRTDLVFDYLSGGHAANSTDNNGVSLIDRFECCIALDGLLSVVPNGFRAAFSIPAHPGCG